MVVAGSIKQRLRPIYAPFFQRHPMARAVYALVWPTSRTHEVVSEAYHATWSEYRARLEESDSLERWLCIPGFDDVTKLQYVDGRVQDVGIDTNRIWVDEIARSLRAHFPKAKSITEYGCGVGRNLLALKERYPELACFGYELCEEGVDVARAAAAKFGRDVHYAKLDYVRDVEASYVHPKTDVAFTCWSLAEVPDAMIVGVKNMMDHTRLGTIHVEPVVENYPRTVWGTVGRIYARQIDFMRRFDRSVRALGTNVLEVRVLETSPNPLEPNPSVYVLSHGRSIAS